MERDPFCVSVLRARQTDGVLPQCPISEDVVAYRPQGDDLAADLVVAGFPCQAMRICQHMFEVSWKPLIVFFQELTLRKLHDT